MKAVRLVRSGWWDDVVNGDAGWPLVLEDAAADEHVARGNAVYDPRGQESLDACMRRAASSWPTKVTGCGPLQDLADLTEELGLYDEPVVDQDALEAGYPVDVDPSMKRPWVTASKADWIDWAVHCGADPASAAAQTKAELQSDYGERL